MGIFKFSVINKNAPDGLHKYLQIFGKS
jgi:hypothetical protein